MQMKEIVEKLEEIEFDGFVEHDGDEKDNRLFLPTFYPETIRMNEIEYEKFEEILNTTSLEKPKWDIWFSTDVSGFEYWTVGQKEDNYVTGVIGITDTNLSCDELRELANDINDMVGHLDNKFTELGIEYDPFY